MSRPSCVSINRQALRHNLAVVRSRAPGCKIIAMVKANAYGHGLQMAAQTLQEADALGVACIEEAMVIREVNPKVRIVLMEGAFDRTEFTLITQYKLDCVVHCQAQIEMLERQTLQQPIDVWLKVNTGLQRLGVPLTQAQTAWQRLNQCVNVKSPPKLMTHFIEADIPSSDCTQQQLERFMVMSGQIPLDSEYSLANSAAILTAPQTHADWVRPGIILYGVSPFAEQTGKAFDLQPVMTLTSQLIAIHDCQAGDKVGYGGEWVCPQAMRVGVVTLGYGDGYPRHARAGTPLLLRGKTAPLIGLVSMDMLTIDLRAHPQAKIGDPVVAWGDGLPIEHVARHADTIANELLSQINHTRLRHIIETGDEHDNG